MLSLFGVNKRSEFGKTAQQNSMSTLAEAQLPARALFSPPPDLFASQRTNAVLFPDSVSNEQDDKQLRRHPKLWFSPGHSQDCECCLRPLPMQQTLDEMEWERGIWGVASAGKLDR